VSPGLQHDDRHPAFDEMGGGGEALGAGADHDDGQRVIHRAPPSYRHLSMGKDSGMHRQMSIRGAQSKDADAAAPPDEHRRRVQLDRARERTDGGGGEMLARTFKALGDPTRVRLLSLIAASQGGEACICDLTSRSASPSRPSPTT
jgi:hypothetical protein